MNITINSVELSVVVPLYNEEPNIDHLFERLESVLERLNTTYEIVCVNDGSKDDTFTCLIRHHNRNPAIKAINLSRNFGKEIALTAAIDFATGAAVVPIDADLQDPPELIEQMLAKWREGYDVVYATRRSRQGESWFKRLTADVFYRTIGKMTRVPIPRNTGDFRLLDRRVVEAIKQMPERTRFMKGLFTWVGFKQTSILFDREPRFKGQTTFNYWKLWNFALDGITSFSFLPLKVWSYIGLIISLISLLYASFLIIRTLIFGIDVPGYASLMVAVLFLGGIQLLTLGIIGEYLGRVYEEVKERPLYFVRESYGFSEKSEMDKEFYRNFK
ncbi:MAG: glycosyltransferase family 2 protein [Symploca sp. SIO3C6]|uniref:Glycosyltransferase family 2 protein n=1 Tax=Symploca sp. SIO1C4 TaxID=2607765 RepID=A0A6B3NBD5_9CYAN|nr:glycosyltransferase family 2 protein [Symploca sp. SIO3C6]NER28225.1 glycosyltransferase family 2 protein [Symploca sp. SIO1C4]NET03356.1 glycosyltransferase family 2 protein [Symploca sp. SIO2B6]